MQSPLMENLRWMRLFGDTIFAIGAIAFAYFAVKIMITPTEIVHEPAGDYAEA
jgi:nitric oxide reductase large subunit